MKRKGMKTIITLCMVFSMLLGSVLTVSATDTTGNGYYYEEIEPDNNGEYVYALYANTGEQPVGASAVIGKTYKYTVTYKSTVPLFGIVEFREADGVNGRYYQISIYNTCDTETGKVSMLNMGTKTIVSGTYTIDDGEQNTVDSTMRSYTVFPSYGGNITTNMPLFDSTETAVAYFANGDESGITNKKPMSDTSLAEFDENLDFKNLRYQELSGTPRSHSISWDANSAYDENTYVAINVDIKWKPILSSLNTVNAWEWVSLSDKYPATNNNYTCLVTEPWQAYFEANSIDWSLFNTQWVDCFYLQVYKYHPDTDTWTYSDVWYVDPGNQTTGASGLYSFGTADMDNLAGEYIKNEVGIGNSVSGEYVGGVIEDIYNNIGDSSNVSSYFEGVWKAFTIGFSSLAESIGELPNMIASVVSFLPPSIITLIGLGIIIAIFLRIVGR